MFVCEICGGNEIIKQDGVFCCQSCGMKYSAEEVRSLMSGNCGSVVSAPPVNSRSNEVKNLLDNADGTFHDGNYETAVSLYSQVLNLEPENAHSIIFRAIASAWSSTVKDCKIGEVNRACERAFKIAHDKYGDSKEYFDFCIEATEPLPLLLGSVANMYVNYYEKAKPYNGLSITSAIATSGIAREVKNTATNGIENAGTVAKNIYHYITDDVKNFEYADKKLWKNLTDILDSCTLSRRLMLMGKANLTEKLIAEISEKQKQIINNRIENFWNTYPEKKKEREDIKKNADAEIAALQERREKLPVRAEIAALKETIKELDDKFQKLSIFKSKERKDIQTELDKHNAKLTELRVRLKEERAAIDKQVDEIKTESEKKIAEIDKLAESVQE